MLTKKYFLEDDATKSEIFKELDSDEKQVKKHLETLQKWVKQQKHFPENVEDDLIETFLIRNKLNVDRTKERLGRYYTLKAKNVGKIRETRLDSLADIAKYPIAVPLPKLTKNKERVIIVKLNNEFPNTEEEILKIFKYICCVSEYALRCDNCLSYRFILDLDDFRLNEVMRFSIAKAVVKMAFVISVSYMGAYAARVSGVDYLNIPLQIESFWKSFKSTRLKKIKEKMIKRIGVHQDLASLHERVEKAVLPPEYGGDFDLSLLEISDKWRSEIEDNLSILEKMTCQVADMSKIFGNIQPNEYFGPEGTFRRLQVD